jgi:TetR/AcrR family transcriptional regulator, transcriptional repressor for nem operon
MMVVRQKSDDGRIDSSQADRPDAETDLRSTNAQAAENRDRIIAEAARQFRARGFAGIGVAELMRRVGLTHGGFYVHFASKEELMQLACRRAVSDMLEEWRAQIAAAPSDPLGAIVRPYLSQEHRDRPATGCLMAALGPDAARQTAPVRGTVTECLRHVLDTLEAAVPAPDAAERRRQAILLFATLVGTMVTARAVSDPELSDEILATTDAALDTGMR